ncbi:MAG TPA: response regulator [Synergistaceae bacterium]|nr:response regulator [Synergistaceae bacterium]HPQ37925.1 response regulator [Synergistaceae bacterium]
MNQIPVLVVEDDPMVVEIHQRYLAALEDFVLGGVAENGEEALKILEARSFLRLVMLDVYMPRMDGITLLREIRRTRCSVDVIAVTAASEPDVVQSMLRNGAFDYLVKPFSFERYSIALEAYVHYSRSFEDGKSLDQEALDTLAFRRRRGKELLLPKGLHEEKLGQVLSVLRACPEPCSANEVAERTGVSRVTARRYLEFLVASGKAVTRSAYQHVGRPVKMYVLLP